MAIVKQGMSDYQGYNRKITSHSNFKLRFSEKILVVVEVFCFNLVWFEKFSDQD